MTPTQFSNKILKFYDQHGRKDLPWQQNNSAYSVWVSEIMLQQTQVKTVIPYYLKFISSFTTVEALAKADIDDVLHHWAGLGYYSRARNLHACAKMVVEQYKGIFPSDIRSMVELPGIGESTGGAILSLAYGLPEAILDGNVKRVLARVFLVEGWYGSSQVSKTLWQLSRKYTPKTRTSNFNQAMMDLGADICNRANPRCDECPLSKNCKANMQDKTVEYPHRKPQKTIQTRSATMQLELNNKQQVRLFKRPPSGIWGGLWSLPEIDLKSGQYSLIGQFKHTFSHYHLQATVVEAKQKNDRQASIQDNQQLAWHNIDKLSDIALPTPIKKYLFKHLKIKEK